MEAWTEDVGDDPEWEDKQDDRLLWRGSTTGILFKPDNPWSESGPDWLFQLTRRHLATDKFGCQR